jgi:all-trans-retinol dehydrogenase (NAD+)
MLELGRGHVVAIGSNLGLVGKSYCCDYASTKFGIIGFMESLADELHHQRKDFINFTVVNPAAIATGLSKPLDTRFPRLLPVMDTDFAAKEIVEAILRNRVSVTIPRGYRVLYAILRNCSYEVRQLVLDYIGNTVQPNLAED